MANEKTCPVELKPMSDWIQEDDPENCRPCMLGVVAQWYTDELKSQGRSDLASPLEHLAEKTDVNNAEQVLTLCQEFDKIKDTVEDPLRDRLKEFDCSTQAFNPDEAVDE
jgi:hypothetical protein